MCSLIANCTLYKELSFYNFKYIKLFFKCIVQHSRASVSAQGSPAVKEERGFGTFKKEISSVQIMYIYVLYIKWRKKTDG